ncbi:hypothetical protein PCC8801_0868 [Rippkaea orientalis PCC 8801]|uniref:Surface-adhesin protein E-like domain-containing protein n=1 Tax=Rippkaea orientalis (strain PCC 8801 / RF-1) TaxID=41431 RepID=B7JZK3_RIPO1|nr:surface-adhesin E family protein [Rippkaea orientalis]ACK64946.1 hypothetical protein PCC8801_0868 [Rippkaea orientalis PCC 8801]
MNRLLKGLAISVLAVTLGIINPVSATQWVYLGTSQDNYSYYLDFDSLKGTGNSRSFWVKRVNNYGETESLIKSSIDCHYRQIGVIESIRYNVDGSVRSHDIIDSNTGGTWAFAPGTIAQTYYDFVCSRITLQPEPQIAMTTHEYPKAACGDPSNSTLGRQRWYPVFVDYSPEDLRYIKKNLCRDAFRITRQDGSLSIQVASFTTKRNAEKFAAFLEQELGNSEVGNPTIIVIR